MGCYVIINLTVIIIWVVVIIVGNLGRIVSVVDHSWSVIVVVVVHGIAYPHE